MRWLAIIVALMLSAPAFARSTDLNEWHEATASLPAGKVINCDTWYSAIHDHAVTILAVRIADTGDVLAASVLQTSGNTAADDAALACSKYMYIAALTSDGHPVEVTWIVRVTRYTTGTSDYVVPRTIADKTACEYPRMALYADIRGTSGLLLRVGADGKVENATVAESSGAKMLDDAAVRCALSWVYPPVLIDGKPGAVDLPTSINWDLGQCPPDWAQLRVWVCSGRWPPVGEP